MKYEVLIVLLTIVQCFEGTYYIDNHEHNKNFQGHLILNSERIFPVNLNIVLYLTKASSGLIFYSMDQFDYQFEVFLKFAPTPTLSIKGLGEVIYRDLRKLCKCSAKCLFMDLDLVFQITKNNKIFSIHCGLQTPAKSILPETLTVLRGYPLPEFQQEMVNEVFLYFVNLPYMVYDYENKVYPYRSKINGCIKRLSHQNISIELLKKNNNTYLKCENQCKKDICNGGSCIETYFSKPICECRTAFGNGEFCNNTLTSINKNQYMKLKAPISISSLKISWIIITNNSSLVLRIKNRNATISLYTNEEKNLKLDLISKKINCSYIINDLLLNSAEFYSIILKINNNSFEYKFIIKSSQVVKTGIIYHDLDSQFSSLYIGNTCNEKSFNGTFDIVYKSKEIQEEWRNILLDVFYYKCTNSTNIWKLRKNMNQISIQNGNAHQVTFSTMVVVLIFICIGVLLK